MRRITLIVLLPLLACAGGLLATDERPENGIEDQPLLVNAVMCEAIQDGSPISETVIFSVSSGTAVCYTAFDPVPKKTIIYHDWYKRERRTSRVKLRLEPPRWSTFSRVQLRESDKGPWRVEIIGEDGTRHGILRFSITD